MAMIQPPEVQGDPRHQMPLDPNVPISWEQRPDGFFRVTYFPPHWKQLGHKRPAFGIGQTRDKALENLRFRYWLWEQQI
jgi:hypothetical protein